jgi:hypothetical protein
MDKGDQKMNSKLNKTAITKMLNRAGLAQFSTWQFGNDVVITFDRNELANFERVLDVQGFGYDVCAPTFSDHGARYAGQTQKISQRVIRVLLGSDDIYSAHTALIVSFAKVSA